MSEGAGLSFDGLPLVDLAALDEAAGAVEVFGADGLAEGCGEDLGDLFEEGLGAGVFGVGDVGGGDVEEAGLEGHIGAGGDVVDPAELAVEALDEGAGLSVTVEDP